MSDLSVYVIANGDLFTEAFNAIVTLLGTSTFQTAFRLATLFALLSVVVAYIKGRDLSIIGRWFMLYFVVTVILLGPKMSINIFDSSDPGAIHHIDHVPFGVAVPASLITSVAYGLEDSVEEVFHMPDDASYAKTGMLFGSQLYRLSTSFHIVDPQVRADLNEYIKNCVIGDMLINKKYSAKELQGSQDIWATISAAPSPIRGILSRDNTFKTCQQASGMVKNAINKDVQNGFKFFGIRIFGGKNEAIVEKNLRRYLQSASNYYGGVSHSAEQLMTQDVLINAIRDGVLSYTTEAGATAALLNLSTTQSMERLRMAWATSRNMALYVLPVLQTDLLLLMLCLFPIIIMFTIHPGFGYGVFKNYLIALIWLESWPLLFSFLNFAVTFYVSYKTSNLAQGGLTLGNSDVLAREHSDVGNMAGYLMTCVPFIAIGIIKGMASTFSSASQYIGGMLHSTASGSASEAVTGNISLGNTSLNNMNANKYDTNSSFMHGMSTEQLANGATVTHTISGKDVWNTGSATSHLATHIHAGSMISSSLSKQAEASLASASQSQMSFNQSVSNAASKLENFNKTVSSQQSFGENFSNQETQSYAEHASDMYSLVSSVAHSNGKTWNDTFRAMSSLSKSIELHGSGSTPGTSILPASVGGSVNWQSQHNKSSEQTTGHELSSRLNVSNEDLKKFSNDWNVISQYSKTQHVETGNSAAASELSQISQDFRKADTASANYSSSITDSERLSNQASFVQQNSEQIDSNFDQGFADYVKQVDPGRANEILGNTSSLRVAQEREVLANRYVQSAGFQSQITAEYIQRSGGINPTQSYHLGSVALSNNERKINTEYQNQAQNIKSEATANGAIFNQNAFELTKQSSALTQNVNQKVHANEQLLKQAYKDAQSFKNQIILDKKEDKK